MQGNTKRSASIISSLLQGRLVLGQEPQTIEMSIKRGNVDGSGTIIGSLLQGRLVLGQEPQTIEMSIIRGNVDWSGTIIGSLQGRRPSSMKPFLIKNFLNIYK